MYNKKGLGLGDAFPAVLTVGILAILIIAVIYFFSQFGTAIGTPNSYTVTNETFTITTAGTAVANSTACNFGTFVVTQIRNNTNNVVPASNYSASSTGRISNLSTMAPYGTSLNVSYTYKDGGSACTATQTFTTNFTNQVPLIGLVLTIVLIAIVIGVLVSSFFMKGSRV